MTIRATTVRPGAAKAADTITLDEDRRHRRRMAMVSDHGIAFLLDLPEARLLNDGDGLELEDGRIIRVVAAPEPLYEVRGADPHHLLRLAWHMGNRHLPAEILADRILIRRDHVIRAMLEGLGAAIAETEAPFHPEGGAYGDTHAHHHHHHGDHD